MLAKVDDDEVLDPSFVDTGPSGSGKGSASKSKAKKPKDGQKRSWTATEEVKWRAAFPEFNPTDMNFPSVEVRERYCLAVRVYWASNDQVIKDKDPFPVRFGSRTGYEIYGKKQNTTVSGSQFFVKAMLIEKRAIDLYRQEHLNKLHLGGIRQDLTNLISPFASPVNVDEDGNPVYVWIDGLKVSSRNRFLKASLKTPSMWIRDFSGGDRLRTMMRSIDGIVSSALTSPVAKSGKGGELDPSVVKAVELLAHVSIVRA